MNKIDHIKEQVLLRKCKKGDAKAQFAIYKQYYKAMYNVALRIVRHTAEAEDIMQEAFLTAFDKLESFSGEVSFGGWLRRIVANRALDVLRQRKLEMDDIDNHQIEVEDELPVDGSEAKVRVIKAVVAGMNDTARVLLTLHLFEGYSHEEVAEILDMKHGAVRTGYARAKSKLQGELELMNESQYN